VHAHFYTLEQELSQNLQRPEIQRLQPFLEAIFQIDEKTMCTKTVRLSGPRSQITQAVECLWQPVTSMGLPWFC